MQHWSAQNFVQDAGLIIGRGLAFRPPGFFLEKRQLNRGFYVVDGRGKLAIARSGYHFLAGYFLTG